MRFLALLILLTFQQLSFAQKKISWKIYDNNLKEVAKVRTTGISIADNLIWFQRGGKYGVMDMQKNILIEPKFESIYHYGRGVSSVGLKRCYGLVYKDKQILPLKFSNGFVVDSSGYIMASQGCSEYPEAYFISEYGIYDTTGTLISMGCEADIVRLFNQMTGRRVNKTLDVKRLSNGFTIKVMPSERFLKKGIFNRNDSLIFSCEKCTISDNIDGQFLIRQRRVDNLAYESYTIDTSGVVRIKDNYSILHYLEKYKLYIYGNEKEKGYIDTHGRAHAFAGTDKGTRVDFISEKRFLISIPDSTNDWKFTIGDSSGAFLFEPVKERFKVINENCLVHQSPAGFMFTDADAKPVSNTYDSVFVLPDFDYIMMVLKDQTPRGYVSSGVGEMGPLHSDGFAPIIHMARTDYYGIAHGRKLGVFLVSERKEITPQFEIVAQVNEERLTAHVDGKWFVIDKNGELKSLGKCRYINFFANHIVTGN